MTTRTELMALDKLRQTHQIDNPEYFDRIEALIESKIEAIIGPDEPEDLLHGKRDLDSITRNTLKSEQRARANLGVE